MFTHIPDSLGAIGTIDLGHIWETESLKVDVDLTMSSQIPSCLSSCPPVPLILSLLVYTSLSSAYLFILIPNTYLLLHGKINNTLEHQGITETPTHFSWTLSENIKDLIFPCN